ncbi:hypothetical protein GCM10028777_23570 [Angustibacter speluncae]
MRPGLDDDELDRLAGDAGWRLPAELKVLWGWHDGAQPGGPRSIGPGGYEFLSLREALDETAQQRSWFPAGDHTPIGWQPHWLVLMTQGPQRLYADCTTDDPLRNPWLTRLGMVPWEWEDADLAVAGSLLHAVSLWRWLLDHDHYEVEDGGDLQPRDFPTWPLWLRLSALA